MSNYSRMVGVVGVMLLWSGLGGVEVGGQQECMDVAEVLEQCSTYLVRVRVRVRGVFQRSPPSLICCNELRGLSFMGAIGDTHRICKCMQTMIPAMADLDSSHVAYLFNKCDALFNFDLSSSATITCP